MISPFTPEELDLVSSLIRSRYLAHTPVEDIEAEVQLGPAQATLNHGQDAEFLPGGRRLFTTNMPRHARAFACTGEFDLVCCGHDHRARVENALRRAHDGELVSFTISRQPTREVHHPEGVFVAHWSD